MMLWKADVKPAPASSQAASEAMEGHVALTSRLNETTLSSASHSCDIV
jgi:hypothetical protein